MRRKKNVGAKNIGKTRRTNKFWKKRIEKKRWLCSGETSVRRLLINIDLYLSNDWFFLNSYLSLLIKAFSFFQMKQNNYLVVYILHNFFIYSTFIQSIFFSFNAFSFNSFSNISLSCLFLFLLVSWRTDLNMSFYVWVLSSMKSQTKYHSNVSR